MVLERATDRAARGQSAAIGADEAGRGTGGGRGARVARAVDEEWPQRQRSAHKDDDERTTRTAPAARCAAAPASRRAVRDDISLTLASFLKITLRYSDQ